MGKNVTRLNAGSIPWGNLILDPPVVSFEVFYVNIFVLSSLLCKLFRVVIILRAI